MIEIGKYNKLVILRECPIGLMLGKDEHEVLLPSKYVPEAYEIGQEVIVFVYLDQQERPVATTLEPYIYRNEFGYLRVAYKNEVGAFLDWGLEKDLFVPYREQHEPMVVGQRYVVYMYLDPKSQRLVASSRIGKFIDNTELTVSEGDEVEAFVTHFSDAGINVIVNEFHRGLIHKNTVFTNQIRIGDRLTAYVKAVRPDNKLDIVLEKIGFERTQDHRQIILEALEASNNGFLPLSDKSAPEDIHALLSMSKKAFKTAIGTLYKDRKITLDPDGIRLIR